MSAVILNEIPFRLDLEALLQSLHLSDKPDYADEIRRLTAEAEPIARPRAAYRAAAVESRSDDSVAIDGTVLRSRILRVNFEKAAQVYPFVATCGRELEEWSASVEGMFRRYGADRIKEAAVDVALQALLDRIRAVESAEHVSMISPGTVLDWPTEEQRPLFRILGEAAPAIGVELTEACIMFPIKSVSGILFATEEAFESCRLCPAKVCRKRRAPYDVGHYERAYARG